MQAAAVAAPPAYLAGPRFDRAFVALVPALAFAVLALALAEPRALVWVLSADLWLLSVPHTASTFTRLLADRARAGRDRALLFLLPPASAALVLGLLALGGATALNSVYFYWQSFHYARQSYGVHRGLARAAGQDLSRGDPLAAAVLYLFPLWGVLHRVAQRPGYFYFARLWTPAIPAALVHLAGAAALLALAAWTVRLVRGARAGAVDAAPAAYLVSHVLLFTVGYVLVADATRGWLAVNVWHNAQYLLFVWAHHHRAARAGRVAPGSWLAALSYAGRLPAFLAACFALGGGAYLLAFATARGRLVLGYPLFLAFNQVVNFHHYVVDMVIWRSRRAG